MNSLTPIIRPATASDLEKTIAMHLRCSADTLSRRYGARANEALGKLVRPLFAGGTDTLVAESLDGEIVAIGHLIGDGYTARVGLLVEDVWQGRGLGTILFRDLITGAEEEGFATVTVRCPSEDTRIRRILRHLGVIPVPDEATGPPTAVIDMLVPLSWTAGERAWTVSEERVSGP
ncbi:GNAT family N-acetyltransferase [Streptomyces flaveolus]|uniref:GNAT family N-acetyltransferase n=1 Tax=Streptomyces flaveolus TaxID=67297 RepID=UPI00342B0FBA